MTKWIRRAGFGVAALGSVLLGWPGVILYLGLVIVLATFEEVEEA